MYDFAFVCTKKPNKKFSLRTIENEGALIHISLLCTPK